MFKNIYCLHGDDNCMILDLVAHIG